jgi:hypothetical protein
MSRLLFTLWGALAFTFAGLATPEARAQGALPLSIAHYEVTHDGRSERLDVVRTSDRIEHRYLKRGITEVWSRDPRGELSHWKVFHQPKRSVHYTAGDLRTIEAEPLWEQLATLLKPGERAKLKTKGSKRTPHGPAILLEGQLDHQKARVLWNEREGWAEEIAWVSGNARKTYRLLSNEPCTPTVCASVDMRDVREIEFADLGDMETDPFVHRFLATFGGDEHSHH